MAQGVFYGKTPNRVARNRATPTQQSTTWSPEAVGWPHLHSAALWCAVAWLAATVTVVADRFVTLSQGATDQALMHFGADTLLIVMITLSLLKDLQGRPFVWTALYALLIPIALPRPPLAIIWHFLPVDVSMMAAIGWGVTAWECNPKHIKVPTKLKYEVSLEQTALAAVTLTAAASVTNLVIAGGGLVSSMTLVSLFVTVVLAGFIVTSHFRSVVAIRTRGTKKQT